MKDQTYSIGSLMENITSFDGMLSSLPCCSMLSRFSRLPAHCLEQPCNAQLVIILRLDMVDLGLNRRQLRVRYFYRRTDPAWYLPSASARLSRAFWSELSMTSIRTFALSMSA